MDRILLKGALVTILAVSFLLVNAMAAEVEVLHWWTSDGESRAVAELKKRLQAKGDQWKDFAVVGGGGGSAMIFLKSRVVSGNPPTVAQIKGPSIQEWGAQGVLVNLDAIAEAERWDDFLPVVIRDIVQYDGRYVAVPFNVHRVNWMWVNPEIFERAGAKIPMTWEEFGTAAQKIRKAGFIPVAQGGQPWQETTTFESIVLAVGGTDFYHKAFVDLDPAALDSPPMVKAFELLRTVQEYTDEGAPGRDWDLATAMLINGKAAMHFMGDWAKGEFAAAGKVPGEDYICVPMPGTQGMFVFNIDSFVMFRVKDPNIYKAQMTMARIIMEPEFQEVFNLSKGSIPARLNVPREKFDVCARDAMDELVTSARDETLIPSMSQGMATFSSVQGAVFDVVTEFYNSTMSAEDAARKLVQSVQVNK